MFFFEVAAWSCLFSWICLELLKTNKLWRLVEDDEPWIVCNISYLFMPLTSMMTWSSWFRWITCSCLKIVYDLINVFEYMCVYQKDFQQWGLVFTCVNVLHTRVSIQLGWFVRLIERMFHYRNYQISCMRGETWSTLFHIPSPFFNGKTILFTMSLCSGQLFTTNRPPKIIRTSFLFFFSEDVSLHTPWIAINLVKL